jgi:hypothetical protein
LLPSLLAVWLTYSSKLNIKAVHSSKTSVNFYQTAWHHIPERYTLHSHCLENLECNYRYKVFKMMKLMKNLESERKTGG